MGKQQHSIPISSRRLEILIISAIIFSLLLPQRSVGAANTAITSSPPLAMTVATTHTYLLSADQDTQITSKNETPWGAEKRLYTWQDNSDYWWSLFHFDLASVPSGVSVVSATVKLYMLGSDGTPISLHRVTTAWDEDVDTRLTLGNAYDPAPTTSFTPAPIDQYSTVDVTVLTQAWLDGVHPNDGFLLKAAAGGDHTIASKESTNSNQRPVLELVVAAQSLTLDAAQDTWLQKAQPGVNYGGCDTLTVDVAGGGHGDGRTLLRFDLSEIPAGAQIVAADLQLTKTGGDTTSKQVEAHRVLSAWSEGSGGCAGITDAASWNQRQTGVNWGSAGGDVDAAVLASVAVGGNGVYTWQVTAAAQQWNANWSTNYGLLLDSPETGTPKFVFASRQHALAANRPQLSVRYVGGQPGIGDRLWDDRNRNGAQDAGEPGLANLTVNLYAGLCETATDAVFRTTVTDSDGGYAFAPLDAGAYCIRVDAATLPIGYLLTTNNPSLDVTLGSGQFFADADFGYASATADDRLAVGAYAPCADAAWLQQLAQSYGATITDQNPSTCGYTVQAAPATLPALQAAVTADPHARHAGADSLAQGEYTPNDPDYNDPSKVYGPQQINAPAAWDVTLGDPNLIVAIVDTGIDPAHPEFAGRLLAGYDFVNGDADTRDDNGHGTHVAGIAAAGINNGIGMAGIAGVSKILPVKVLSANNTGWWSDIADGITWAVDHGARVINLSIAGAIDSRPMRDAIAYANAKNVVVVASAGNNGAGEVRYPASNEGVIAVGATTPTGARWTLSNFGPNVDLMAPGVSIYSSHWSATGGSSYRFLSGTSMAAPHVAGAALLLLGRNPSLTSTQVKELLLDTAVDLDAPGVDSLTGYGLLNMQAALAGTPIGASITLTSGLSATLVTDVNGNGLVDVGDTLRYDLTAVSPTAMSNVVVSANTPSYTTYVSGSTRLNGIPVRDDDAPKTPQPLDEGGLNIGALAANGSALLSFDVVVGPLPRGVYAVVGQATVQTAVPQSFSVTTPVAGTLLHAVVDKTSAQIGQSLTYTLSTDYLGNEELSSVVVTASVPAGTTYAVGSANAGGTENGGVVTWNLGSNAAGVPEYEAGSGGGVEVFKTGSFTKTTGGAPASQSITHNLGASPKALILWTAGRTSESPTASFWVAQGFSDGATSYSFAAASSDAQGLIADRAQRIAAKALTIVVGDESVAAQADLSNWDASQFTLNWTTNDSGARIIHYLIIGGDNVSAKVVNWTMPTSTGNRSVTGVGFRPDLVLHIHGTELLTGGAPNSDPDAGIGLGAMNGAGEQWASFQYGDDINYQTSRGQRTDSALAVTDAASYTARASYVSMNSDGFTLNFATASQAGQVVSLALQGMASKVGSFNKITGAGAQALTGVGFRPEALVLSSWNRAANTGDQASLNWGLSVSDGSHQSALAALDLDNTQPSFVRGLNKTTKLFSKMSNAGAVDAEADLTSLDADGFTLNWTANDSVASQMLYLALAPASAPVATSSISQSTDDAEEYGPGVVAPSTLGQITHISTDLEMVDDFEPVASGTQQVGMRFNTIDVPKGATITNAYITFRAVAGDSPATNTGATSLTIRGQAADNPATFTTATNNISSRPTTTASVAWPAVAPWTTGTDYSTPNLNTVVQELVDRSGWVSGNSMVFIVTGSGSRSAESWDNSGEAGTTGTNQPRLVIEYQVNTGSNGPSLGNTLSTAPTLVTANGLITVTQVLTASQQISNVTPALLSISGANGVNATLISGPTPANATVGPAGASFTWVYRATAGANIGQLTFSGNATGLAITWPNATSNSAIVHPPLTFRTSVIGAPAGGGPIHTTGFIHDAGSRLPSNASNTPTTGLFGTIGDRVWNDQDGDAIQDGSEPGIANVTVQLTNGSGGVTTTTTNGSGMYSFGNLLAGAYTVTVDAASVPPEFELLTTRYPLQLSLRDGEVLDGADVGLRGQATAVGDTIWYDADADGLQDPREPGIGNITLDLYFDDGDGVFNPGFDFLADSTTSDANGAYRLDAPADGLYFVNVTDAAGLLATLVHTVGPQSLTDPSPTIPLAAGQHYRDADFGYVRVPQAGHGLIGDLVWVDGNSDGTRELNEPILIGVTVCATPTAGGQPRCAVTDSNGRYLIEAPASEYSVTPSGQPAGLLPSTPSRLTVDLAAGQQQLAVDFGFSGGSVPLGGIGGTIWQDMPVDERVDGVYTPASEPGIPEVSVGLIRDVDGNGAWSGVEPYIATFSTLAGSYHFDGLPAGAYLVRVTDTRRVLRRFAVTRPGPTAATGADHQNKTQPYPLALAPGGVDTSADFGYREYEVFGAGDPPPPGVIGDLVWLDVVADGSYDPQDGDQPLPGVTVVLRNGAGAQIATSTTGIDGKYLFTDLPTGDYTVSVSDAFGVLADLTLSAAGAGPGLDNTNQAQPYAVTLGLVSSDLTADFGYTDPPVGYTIANSLASADNVRPGQPVVFSIQITNTGGVTITQLPLSDSYSPSYLRYVNATPAPNNDTDDGQIDWSDLTVSFGRDLAPGQSFTVIISFTALADTTALAPNGATETLATVSGAWAGAIALPEQMQQTGAHIESPTAVMLASAGVDLLVDGVFLTWATLDESNIAGFRVYRQVNGGELTALGEQMIAAQKSGAAEGAVYSLTDTGVTLDAQHRYLLQVITLNGSVVEVELGSVYTAALRIYLPVISRQ
jgi:uncharacterized repeat protein (TIGR01451 family)